MSTTINRATLASFSTIQLTDELKRRGLAVSVWGVNDLDFLDEDPSTESLSEAQLADLKFGLLTEASAKLVDILAERGNEVLTDVWGQHQTTLLATVTSPERKRYIVGQWEHLMPGQTLCRIVIDQDAGKLVHAQRRYVIGWVNCSKAEMADLEDSLVNANDVLTAYDDFSELSLAQDKPGWALAQTSATSANNDRPHSTL